MGVLATESARILNKLKVGSISGISTVAIIQIIMSADGLVDWIQKKWLNRADSPGDLWGQSKDRFAVGQGFSPTNKSVRVVSVPITGSSQLTIT